ncbi:MAG: DNA-binding protein [Nitrospinota bacterium]|nr:MAG: DNA-binding protein [Nitrospinota bacterium]
MDRVFLDANVLFSVAYRTDAGLQRLWTLKNVTLITSVYALEEARVNLSTREQRIRLANLARALHLVTSLPTHPLPTGVHLPAKDHPILLAAMAANATHLLAGDVKHFGPYYGQTIAGILILPPATYLHGRLTAPE